MTTNWDLIRELMNSTIDTCEAIDKLQVQEQERSATIALAEHDVSIWEILQSAKTAPDNLFYAVIRAQHQLNADKAYTTELAHMFANVGKLCAELADTKDIHSKVSKVNPHHGETKQSIAEMTVQLSNWYKNHMLTNVQAALSNARLEEDDIK